MDADLEGSDGFGGETLLGCAFTAGGCFVDDTDAFMTHA
jgi:hypothetical protein